MAALSARMEKRKAVVEEHARIDALYRMTSGNVSGSRMDLETFVQRYYLERILYAANRRFQEMSAGQFELLPFLLLSWQDPVSAHHQSSHLLHYLRGWRSAKQL